MFILVIFSSRGALSGASFFFPSIFALFGSYSTRVFIANRSLDSKFNSAIFFFRKSGNLVTIIFFLGHFITQKHPQSIPDTFFLLKQNIQLFSNFFSHNFFLLFSSIIFYHYAAPTD